MENQQFRPVSPSKPERKTSWIALLFFLFGALHIYGQIQSFSQWDRPLISLEINPLVKVALVALVTAGILELLVL
jgi:hypothetical protein